MEFDRGAMVLVARDFFTLIKGEKIDLTNHNNRGNFIEHLLGIKPNSRNEPDLYGLECKSKEEKITFFDLVPEECPWSLRPNTKNGRRAKKKSEWEVIDRNFTPSKSVFMKYFGVWNSDKRYWSWSGEVFPKVSDEYNFAGQKIVVNNEGITIYYSKSHDTRPEKLDFTEIDPLPIIFYSRERLETAFENKFSNGYFLCDTIGNSFEKIHFGRFTFETFIEGMKSGIIYIDSGNHEGAKRNRWCFRAPKNFWMKFIFQTYE
jgi:hypothetical protein